MNKVQEIVNNKEDMINNKINLFQRQLNEKIHYLSNVKSNDNNNKDNNKSISFDDDSDNNDLENKEKELKPYRIELENIKSQKILMFVPPQNSPPHPKTIYFLNDPNLNENPINKKIKQKKLK